MPTGYFPIVKDSSIPTCVQLDSLTPSFQMLQNSRQFFYHLIQYRFPPKLFQFQPQWILTIRQHAVIHYQVIHSHEKKSNWKSQSTLSAHKTRVQSNSDIYILI